jgi:hypothetical protein
MNESLYFTFWTLLLKLFVQFCWGFVFIIATVVRKYKELLSVYC